MGVGMASYGLAAAGVNLGIDSTVMVLWSGGALKTTLHERLRLGGPGRSGAGAAVTANPPAVAHSGPPWGSRGAAMATSFKCPAGCSVRNVGPLSRGMASDHCRIPISDAIL